MLTKTKAIVLRSFKLGDSQLIIDAFTEEYGRRSLVCRLSASRKAKFKKQLFQPLTQLAVEFDDKAHGGLHPLQHARIERPYRSLPFEPLKLSISLFLSEFLLHATRGEQQNPPLYLYMTSSLEWLDLRTASFVNFHLVFALRLARFIGFYPNLDGYSPGCYFDLREGRFRQSAPLHPDYLQSAEAARISLLMRMNYDNMHLFRMSRTERNRCLQLIITYYRLHVPDFPALKSPDVLQALFDDQG